jgi:hypothetical protein
MKEELDVIRGSNGRFIATMKVEYHGESFQGAKYVMVRLDDLDWLWSCADNHYQSELRALGQERLDEKECGREIKAALDRVRDAMRHSMPPAIAKGGEPGEGR